MPSNVGVVANYMSHVDQEDQVNEPKKKKRKKVKIKKKVNDPVTQQNRMTEYLSNLSNVETRPIAENDERFGSRHTSKQPNTIRIWYTNPNGIGVNFKASKSHASFAFLKRRSKADIVGLVETNVNWSQMRSSSSLYSRLKSNWKYFRSVTAHNINEEKPSKCQRGGTCSFAVGQVSHRVLCTGKDQRGLGRWSWIEFGGKGGYRSRFYSAYRPGSKPSRTKLTTVVDQQLRYIGTNNLYTTPVKLFDDDIEMELSNLLLSNVHIVLAIDANDDVENGEFQKMLKSIGLSNAYQNLYKAPMPPTHHAGSKPISSIFCSQQIKVVDGGILQKGIGFQADHRNMFVDVDETSFLGTSMYVVSPPPMKRLKLNDPRVYKKFLNHVQKHVASNSMMEAYRTLTASAKYPPSQEVVASMEALDSQLGRAIEHGLSKCRKLRTGKIPFSGLFKKLWQEKRLWILVYKKKVGQCISSSTIRRLSKRTTYRCPMSLPLKEVEFLRAEAEKKYQALIPHSRSEREQFYEDLASANAQVKNLSKAKILKQIKSAEAIKEQHGQIRMFFPKKTISKRVDKVTYTKNGKVCEASDPATIVNEIQADTIRKYSSTESTPLMQNDVHEMMGNFAETQAADAVFKGVVPYPESFTLWTKKMLDKVKHDANIPRIPITMTTEEVKRVWKITKENKASSFSGRYNAVYKALVTRPKMLQLLTMSMNLPFLTGRPYDRWGTFLDIMSFKKTDSIHVNSLRTIVISEADWNASGRIFITKKMMSQAEKLSLLPKEHMGGRKGRKAITGALTKRLMIDNSRLLRKPMAIISTDAANCYDRMVHKFVTLACMKWGVPKQVMIALLQPLQKARHHTRTAFGDSSQYFEGKNFQGAGQGNTGAAPFWTSVSSPMIELMKERNLHATYTTSLSLRVLALTLIAFVDDAELFVNDESNDAEAIRNKAAEAINVWREVLEVTGGAMRPQKCAWALVVYKNNTTLPKLFSILQKPGDIMVPDEDFDLKAVSRYDGHISRDYLGVRQRIDGSDDDQYLKMRSQIVKWNQLMLQSRMNREYNITAVMGKINRSLQYPLPALALTPDQCKRLSNKLYSTCLPKFGIAESFPTKRRYLPYKYQGLQLPHLYLEQGIGQLTEVVHASSVHDICWDQLCVGLEAIQMRIGSTVIPFNSDYKALSPLIPTSWYTSLWKFCNDMQVKFKGWPSDVPFYREGDSEIMMGFAKRGYSVDEMRVLNKCRIYLQVFTVADIASCEGTHIMHTYLNGCRDPYRVSSFNWPNQSKPYLQSWTKWQEAIRDTFCVAHDSNKLRHPLGAYLMQMRGWRWYYSVSMDCLLLKDGRIFKVYKRLSMEASTRLAMRWYQLEGIMTSATCPSDMCYATVDQHATTAQLITLDGYSSIPTPAITLQPANVWQALCQSNTPTWMFEHMEIYLRNLSLAKFQLFFTKKVNAVSDGSYKDDIGAAGVILEDSNELDRYFFTVPVPANKHTSENDSYRSEFVGVLFILHIIEMLVGLCPREEVDHVTIGCDNDMVIDAIQYWDYTTASTKHRDVVVSMLATRASVRHLLSFTKIKGHRDKSKPFEKLNRFEQLNVWCDRLAKSARETLMIPDIQDAPFYGEGLSVWLHGTHKLYTNMDMHVRREFHLQEAQSYVIPHHGMTSSTFSDVDWDASEKAMSSLPSTKRIWISKYISHFLPIGRNMVRRTQWDYEYCPRCKLQAENHGHLLLCTHSQAEEIFRVSMESLSEWMYKQHTPDELVWDILHLITEYKLHGKIDSTVAESSFVPPIRAQLLLGWDHFMEGRLTKAFSLYMEEHYISNNIQKKGLTWTTGFISKLWLLVYWPQWTNRNEFVHSLNIEISQTRRREELEIAVDKVYKSEERANLLVKDQYLLEESLEDILQYYDAHLQAWYNQIQVAILQRNRVFNPDDASHSARIRRWMLTASSSRIRKKSSRYKRISPFLRAIRKQATRYK